jgi:hypothetical protein
MTTLNTGTQSSLSTNSYNSNKQEGLNLSGKDAYGGSTFNKGYGTGLEGQQQLGKSSVIQPQANLMTNQQQLMANQQQPANLGSFPASKYSGNIQFGAIPGAVTSNYSIQRFDSQLEQGAMNQNKVLWAGETGPITLQHQTVCLSQEPLMIRPEPIVVPQPPVVFQPDAIQIPQPALMFQPDAIAIPLPPLTIQPEPVVIERPPLVIQPEPVVLRRPDVQMAPSFSVHLKYGVCGDSSAQCVSQQQCPPGTVPVSQLKGNQGFSGSASQQGSLSRPSSLNSQK